MGQRNRKTANTPNTNRPLRNTSPPTLHSYQHKHPNHAKHSTPMDQQNMGHHATARLHLLWSLHHSMAYRHNKRLAPRPSHLGTPSPHSQLESMADARCSIHHRPRPARAMRAMQKHQSPISHTRGSNHLHQVPEQNGNPKPTPTRSRPPSPNISPPPAKQKCKRATIYLTPATPLNQPATTQHQTKMGQRHSEPPKQRHMLYQRHAPMPHTPTRLHGGTPYHATPPRLHRTPLPTNMH